MTAPWNSKSALKSKLVSSVEAITADTTETTLGDDGFFDTRGMEDMQFSFLATTNANFSTGTNFFVGEVWGKDSKDGTAYLIAQTSELVANVAQVLPSAANSEGQVWPRYIQIRWNETGTITDFDATCRLRYNRHRGAGPQVDHGAVS